MAAKAIALSALVTLAAAGVAPPPSTKNTTGAGFIAYCVGLNCEAYKTASPTPGVVLMGGGTDVDAAFDWQISHADGGDFVILRATGSDGYNDYVWELSGGTLNSITSIILTSAEGAEQDFVLAAANDADALFWAGGDQTLYVERISGTSLAAAITARQDAITVGGTSAGCDWLSDFVFAPATDAPSITSPAALRNPYAYGISFADSPYDLEGFGRPKKGARSFLADTHFEQRDRMGRLLTFGARLIQDGNASAAGGCVHLLGVNEQSAFLVEPSGAATIAGPGTPAGFVCELCTLPSVCESGQRLSAGPYDCVRVEGKNAAYDFASWKGQQGSVAYTLNVDRGAITGTPYGP